MEIANFNKVLSKSLSIVDAGIKKGYFDEKRKDELNNKLMTMFKNGIVYDLPGTAIYAMYSPSEKRLYFNTKVFKSEEEALVYTLHEIKHGLDHNGEAIGFEYQNKGVGTNEGATQRFATDLAEEILQIKFPNDYKGSLGIDLKTHLDEYQIEDKLNELFCITMGISMEEYIRIQNDPQKEELNKLKAKFNKHSNLDEFMNALDEIYMIQEETWFDENHNMLEKEKETTFEQRKRVMNLINLCKDLLFEYAQKENIAAILEINNTSFITIKEGGVMLPDKYTKLNDLNDMTEKDMIIQKDYISYLQSILNQIGYSYFDNDCSIVFVTEFKYDFQKLDKKLYFRKGDTYYKLIIPVKSDMVLDIENIRVENVDDINEIKDSIEDCEAEFGIIANGIEYARILSLTGEAKKAQIIINKWNDFLNKQDKLDTTNANSDDVNNKIQSLRDMLDKEDEKSEMQRLSDMLYNIDDDFNSLGL